MKKKVEACFCLTFLGALFHREDNFSFPDFQIHGHYCGWRSDHRRPDGAPLNWKDKEEIRIADIQTRGIDSLDEVCRIHDMEYDNSFRGLSRPKQSDIVQPFFYDPYVNICEADEIAISRMVVVSLDFNNKLSSQTREQGIAMAGSLLMNRETCHIIDSIK